MTEINRQEAHHSFTVMPKDCNFNRNHSNGRNDILFGGKLMYEMDYVGAMIARRATYESDCDMVVTASIDKINFERPAYLGDIVTMSATIKALGRTSIQVRVKARREGLDGRVEQICSSNMTFVSMKDGRPAPHDLNFEKLGS